MPNDEDRRRSEGYSLNPKLNLPIDFNAIRITFVNVIEKYLGVKCVFHEPETQDAPRPPKPYMGFKLTTPSARMGGDDDHRAVLDNMGNPTTVQNSGGQRKMTVSFNAYGRSHEEAYGLMTQWQAALDLYTIQEELRRAKIAVWIIGNVADLSLLLNTGYEGRAQMDTSFGIASNLSEDLSEIDQAPIQGTIGTDAGDVSIDITATV